MANIMTKGIQSTRLGIVNYTAGKGNRNVGYVFGDKNVISSAATGPVLHGTGSTADVTEAWTIILPVLEKMEFRQILTVTTAAGGALNTADYSSALNADKNVVVSIVADARDGGDSGTDPIGNGEVVTVTWRVTDSSTLNSTIFRIKVHGNVSGTKATIKVKPLETDAYKTMYAFAGDVLEGPFSAVEIDALSSGTTYAIVYYQEH